MPSSLITENSWGGRGWVLCTEETPRRIHQTTSDGIESTGSRFAREDACSTRRDTCRSSRPGRSVGDKCSGGSDAQELLFDVVEWRDSVSALFGQFGVRAPSVAEMRVVRRNSIPRKEGGVLLMNICDAVLKSIPRVLTVVIFALIAAALTQPAQAQDYFYYTQPVSPCGYYPVGTSFSESCSSFGLSTLQEYYFDFTPSTTLD